ncbi:MAG: DUF2958 domain-containing protein [Clostridia bacterium]|nr:DUF2958 domain-containing protein [Clostridia bacterium]
MKLMTKEIEKKLAKHPIYSQDGKGNDAEVLVKYFNPYGVGTWLVLEGNKLENGKYEFYGLAEFGHGWEYGYFTQEQLEEIHVRFGRMVMPAIERDLYCGNGKVADFVA